MKTDHVTPVLAALLLAAASTPAANIWDGGGTDNYWNTANNWDNNLVPTFPVGLTFAGSTRLVNTNNLSGKTVNGIIFDAAAGAFTLNGNAITLGGNIGFNANPSTVVTQTINLNLALSVDRTFLTQPNGNLAIGGAISGGYGLFKLGAGTLGFGGSNALSGLQVNGGNLVVSNTLAINGAGGYFYVGNGGNNGGTASCSGALTINSGANISVTGTFGDSLVIGRDSGSGTVTQNGGSVDFNVSGKTFIIGASSGTSTAIYNLNGGTLNVHQTLDLASYGAGAFTSTLNLNGGVITLGSGGITGNGGKATINLTSGTLAASATWSTALNATLKGVGPTFDTTGGNITWSGALSGTGGLTVAGAGVLELSGANAYTGDTTVNAGSTLRLDSARITSSAFRVVNTATLNLNYSGNYSVGGLYTNGVALPYGTYNAANLPGFISPGSTGNLVVQGVSTTQWAGGNGVWDSTTANWQWNASSTTYSDGSKVVFDDTASGASPITVTLNTNVAPTSVTANLTNKNYTITGSGSIGGAGALTKNGPGTLTLETINNTYSGGTVVNGGTLRLAAGSASTNYPGTQAYYQFNNSSSLGQDNSGNTNTLVTGSGSPIYTNNGQFGGALYLNGSSTLTKTVFPTGVPTGASPFTIALWMKTTPNDFGGQQWVRWGSTATTNQLNEFYAGWGNQTGSSITETWNNNNDLPAGLGTAVFTNDFHHVAVTWDGTNEIGYVDGIKVGAQTPTPPNVAATNFVVGSGFQGCLDDLLIGNQALSQIQLVGLMAELLPTMPLPTTTALQIAAGATVDLNGLDQQVGSLAGGGTLTNSGSRAVTLMTGFDNTSTTFAGSIQGGTGLALTKMGSGTTILSGTNRYNGLTTVSEGTLVVNGDNSAATNKVMVAYQASLGGTYQATFGGTGTVGGTVMFGAGSMALFTTAGTLTINGALLASNNVVHLNLSNNVPAGTYVLATYNPTGSSGTFATYPIIDIGSFVLWTTNYIVTGGGQVTLVVGNVAANAPIAGVNVYPPVPGLNPSVHYAVRVCAAGNTNVWDSVFAFETKCKPDWLTDNYFPGIANWTHTYVSFELSNGPVLVEISSLNGNPITNAVVHPLRKSNGVTLANGKAYVTINNPVNVYVDINGQMDDQDTGWGPNGAYSGPPINTITLSANPPLAKPALNDPTYYYVTPGTVPPTNQNLYFLPGVHHIGIKYPVVAGQSIYIPGDAIVYGSLNNDYPGNNIHIFGHGTVSGTGTPHNAVGLVTVGGAFNTTVEGLSLVDAADHTLQMWDPYTPGSPTVASWVKIFTWRANADGINPFGNVEIRNCFIRTGDDCTYLCGAGMSETSFWNDMNGAAWRMDGLVLLGAPTLLVHDCDVLYHRGAYYNFSTPFLLGAVGAFNNGVVFSNIVVEDKFPTAANFNMVLNSGAGDMSGIVFKNVTIAALSVVGQPETIAGAPGFNIHDLTFDNLVIAGKKITSNPFTTNQYVYNLIFTNSQNPGPLVSVTPDSCTFSAPFTVNLCVTADYGYYSINGGAYVPFASSTGAAIPISGTTTLSVYGQDADGNTGTNTNVYTLLPGTPLPGTAAYYQFNVSTNLGLDSSGKTNNLVTASGAPAHSSSGKFGGALYLDGGSTLNKGEVFPTGVPTNGSPYTIALWEKDNGSASTGGFIGWGNSATSQANNLRFAGNNSLQNYWYNNDFTASFSPNVKDGNWHHVAVTYDGTTSVMYVDGVNVGTNNTRTGLNVQPANFVVGKTIADANFKGWIDDLLIASVALTQSQVTNLMAESFSNPNPPVLTTITVSGGNLSFGVTNNGGSYVVQCSTNLANASGWVPIYTNTAPFTFTDSNAVNLYWQRFYRVLAQ